MLDLDVEGEIVVDTIHPQSNQLVVFHDQGNIVFLCTCTGATSFPQSSNLAWACDPIENQYLGRGQLEKIMHPQWALDLSPQYGHVILASKYLVLTVVN